jgi:sugar (pentulose or hexulose) kinase
MLCNIGRIVVTGGATRSPTWLQMHADITGLTVVTNEYPNAGLLGCAILGTASLSSTGFMTLQSIEASLSMIRPSQIYQPDPLTHKCYQELYLKYQRLAPALREIFHSSDGSKSF